MSRQASVTITEPLLASWFEPTGLLWTYWGAIPNGHHGHIA